MKNFDYTKDFLDALSSVYYDKQTSRLSEYLRGECRLLFYLDQNTEAKVQPGELAEKLGITTARVASILRSLESKGMIKRQVFEEDKRKVFVNITEKGKEYSRSKHEYISDFFDRQFAKLTEIERAEYIRLTKKLASEPHEDDGSANKEK